MALEHVIDLNDYSVEQWMELIHLAETIRQNQREYIRSCEGRVMATLFYEPSTRTQMSFQAAMLRLGGQIIGFDNPVNSSVSKGETLRDTIKIVSGYSDLIVIRHPMEGAAKAASLFSQCPIINAGDGGHLHPTQTLTDLVTLSQIKNRMTDLKIGLCGDLKYGRTVHSLIKAMSRFKGNKFYLISTPELSIPSYIQEELKKSGCEFTEVRSIDSCIGELDVLYMTRIQRERFVSPEEYERQRGVFILDTEKMKRAKPDLIVLHPLPRVDEIAFDVDEDKRAAYFKQAEFGMYARMALILKVLNGELTGYGQAEMSLGQRICENPRCIVHAERYLPNYYSETPACKLACLYCDK